MTNETCTVDLEVCLFTSILQIPVIVSALYHERNPQYSSEAQDLPWHIFQSKDEACGSHPWLYIWITCKVFVSVVSTVVSTLLFQCWVSTVVSTLLFQYWRLDLIPRKVGSNKKKRKKMWVHVSGEGQYFLTFLNWSQDGFSSSKLVSHGRMRTSFPISSLSRVMWPPLNQSQQPGSWACSFARLGHRST